MVVRPTAPALPAALVPGLAGAVLAVSVLLGPGRLLDLDLTLEHR